MKGKVKWFDTTKGFGFIQTDDGDDVFVHYTSIESDGFKSLKPDQVVMFEVSKGERGPQAVHVRILA